MGRLYEVSHGEDTFYIYVNFEETTLILFVYLRDQIPPGEGRAVGNLGNAYTALGMFNKAIEFHIRRLQIADASKDLVRAYALSSIHD